MVDMSEALEGVRVRRALLRRKLVRGGQERRIGHHQMDLNIILRTKRLKKAEREREARREYRRRKKESADIHELFMLDIMREGMENGDTRLFR